MMPYDELEICAVVLGNVIGAEHGKSSRVGRMEEREDLMTYWMNKGNERNGEGIGCFSDFYLGGWMYRNANS